MTLQIAPGLQFLESAGTQTFGILAKRGAGKSNAAAVLAEAMFNAGIPFVVVDPVGAWWGLRSSRDGKGPGLAIPIFGGYHGDVPLESSGGQLVADLIVDEQLSCVLDVSTFESEGAKRRFLADFAERLFRQKGKPPHNEEPLHLFLEEADDYAPQTVRSKEGDGARCLGAFQRIVKQGRARGLGATMITQRSAVLNKDLLTQIETLIVLRTTSPQDRKAIEGWVEYHAFAKEILASLHELAPGQAWVWSPWLDLVKQVQFPMRATFDSGATPTGGGKRRAPAKLADVDLEAIAEQMASTMEKAKAEDPKELKARIRELEKKLAAIHKAPSPAVAPVIERVEIPILTDGDREALDGVRGAAADGLEALGEMKDSWERFTERLALVFEVAEKDVGKRAERALPAAPRRGVPAPTTRVAADGIGQAPSRRETVVDAPSGEPVHPSDLEHGNLERRHLTGPQRRVLDAIAWWNEVGFPAPSKLQVGFIAGYRVGKKVGGTFGNVLGALKSADLIAYPSTGFVSLSEAGRGASVPANIPPTIEGLQEAVFERLAEPERRVLAELIAEYPNALAKPELGARAGYTVGEKVGGTFGNILGRLRSLGLIDYNADREAVALPVLFLEG